MNLSDTLNGTVERITFYNPETNYCVLRLRPEQPPLGRNPLVTVVGEMPELQPGESVRLQGRWETHPKHGRQFRAELTPVFGVRFPTPLQPHAFSRLQFRHFAHHCHKRVTSKGWLFGAQTQNAVVRFRIVEGDALDGAVKGVG